jgi:ammonia channel protein AmtB
VVSIFTVVFSLSFVFFKILQAIKLLRSDPAHEVKGLDVPEMGVEGYPKDWEPHPDHTKGIPADRIPAGLPATGD